MAPTGSPRVFARSLTGCVLRPAPASTHGVRAGADTSIFHRNLDSRHHLVGDGRDRLLCSINNEFGTFGPVLLALAMALAIEIERINTTSHPDIVWCSERSDLAIGDLFL